jgi:hypothetical protein
MFVLTAGSSGIFEVRWLTRMAKKYIFTTFDLFEQQALFGLAPQIMKDPCIAKIDHHT